MKLRFSSADVAMLYHHAMRCQEHSPSFSELYDPKLHKGGVIKIGEHGFPDHQNIDLAKVPAALWLVKDHGVYLMSNGFPRLLLDQDNKDRYAKNRVAYANGYDPDNNTDWYDRLGILNGDDFSAALPVEHFAKACDPETRSIRLNVTRKYITVI